MFPMSFDYKVLETLPLQDKEGVNRVISILRTIAVRRVMPHFRNRRGTDPSAFSRIHDHLSLHRLEDEENSVHTVSLVTRNDQGWRLLIHERVFDYLGFVIPSDPKSRIGGGTLDEAKMLAFAEFLLRHEIEHILYPLETERDVIRGDVQFAMERREDDPTFYRMLRNALADEMTGLKGGPYLALLDAAEQGKPYEYLITRILSPYGTILADIPETLLRGLFPLLDTDLKTRVLGECYRRSRDTSYSLLRRNDYLQKVLHLFLLIGEQRMDEAEAVFSAFKERWGIVSLLHELDLPETTLEDREAKEIFALFMKNIRGLASREKTPAPPSSVAPHQRSPEAEAPEKPVKSLKERIEEARNDPSFPRQALEVIDKNKLNAVGHSGSKYTELIETLLVIPWGKNRPIDASPEEFEAGLNRTHYGLEKPKEILCDFFTNLIWRYRRGKADGDGAGEKTGSAFLFVGPPGVGKTSLAISIAENLGIPYHKISLGGMRDEADLRGHGFTYEGSKPGAVVQGLIKMGVMNGMFIMDEADKTEKFAIATLLEILDPEQNHLFHDRYTETTLDIDLSHCHFILTANTLETVPPAVVNRCEVVVLDRYSVEEKIAIAQQHLIRRVRKKHDITTEEIFFAPEEEEELLRYLIKTYTHEAGVRELERIIRALFLRIMRKDVLSKNAHGLRVTREKIKQHLETPAPPRHINEENRVGEMLALGVDVERGIGSIIPIQATPIRYAGDGENRPQSYLSMVHATGNIQAIMDESRKVATTGILHCAKELGIETARVETPVHLHFMGGSTRKDGPSAGGAIALALASALSSRPVRRDVAMTGEIDTQGRITAVGGLHVKLETAFDAGCKTLIIPKENLQGKEGIERLPDSLRRELQILTYEDWTGYHSPFDDKRHTLQVVAVSHIVQAAEIAFVYEEEIQSLEGIFSSNARSMAEAVLKAQKEERRCYQLIYLKDAKELKAEGFGPVFRQGGETHIVLAPDLGEGELKNIPDLIGPVQLHPFDPSEETLSHVLHSIEEGLRGSACLTVVAPFFFLKRDGLRLEDIPKAFDPQRSKIFANNYAVQGMKIKSCKAVLSRVSCRLAPLESAIVEVCPFLGKINGIFAADLTFIPEKYRLDVKQAEDILIRCLKKWLDEMELVTKTEQAEY
jgi:ATP-dependent Lon protease